MRRMAASALILALTLSGCGHAPTTTPWTVQVVAPTDPDGVANLVDAVKGAVVNIDTVSRSPAQDATATSEAQPGTVKRGIGSGVIVRAEGLILTNQHLVSGVDRLNVTLADGRQFTGRVVGEDPVTDLALVRIEAGSPLPTLSLADPDHVRVGQYVVAMGSPLGLQQTVTWGIISALGRTLVQSPRTAYLQTDAPINPGNSGGPLLNLKGEVVGLNDAMASNAQGIGFAIPVSTIKRVLPELEATGQVAHAWIGASVKTSADGGVLVSAIDEGGPAVGAGLRVADRIVSLDGRPVASAGELIRMVDARPVGQAVTLGIIRAGQSQTLSVSLARLPKSEPGRATQKP